jgi:branched-chain amino acid transport system permease protein
MDVLMQFVVSGLSFGGAYGLMALGFTLVYRCSRILNLAQGGVMVLAVLAASTGGVFQEHPLLVLVGSVVGGLALGLLVAVAIVLPFRRKPDLVLLSALLGALFVGVGLAAAVWGQDARTVPPVVTSSLQLGRLVVTGQEAVTIVTVALCAAGVAVWLKHSMLGRALRALGDDAEAAQAVGIPVRTLTAVALGIAGALGALGGALIGPQSSVSPLSGFEWMTVAVIAAVLGGIDSVWGSFLGGIILGLVTAATSVINPQLILVVQFSLLLVTLGVRPSGILGTALAR